jgi:Protein of unknown function (DUF1553)/Protein of unknown function (DUF1549)/Planctomycete cytochrome C
MRHSFFLPVLVLACCSGFCLSTTGRAAEPVTRATAAQSHFFETRIRPLLAEHCFKCHGTKRQRADLRLDSRERLLKGGTSGPVVVPGKPEASLLIKAVLHTDPDLKMPPKERLTTRQVADLTDWVRMGAPFPEAAQVRDPRDEGRNFWAFRPPQDPPIPAVKDTRWARSDLDRLVLATLEAKGLRPTPPADRRTLIRRATFDLTGLPPTPEEIDAFLRDDSPRAFAKVVDRLLASPAYGERWGRHWLDVARYADSNGLDENIAHGNAWRYRDYVIAAFNRDRSYDQFVLEQLAGDLLPSADPTTRDERLTALAFLSMGPKVLAEVDERKMEMDIIDEQIDTVGRAFLALTFGCARCHDHKFDPIETEDYYALAGIFKSTRTMESFKKIARWHENPLASKAYDALKAAHDKKVAGVQARIDQAGKKNGPALDELKRLREELARLKKEAPEAPSAMGVTEGTVTDVKIHIRGSHLNLGKLAPRHVPGVLSGPNDPKFDSKGSGRLQLAQWLVRSENPLTARVMVNRVWRWHFGRGLVGSTDNFGRLGERPSNPALLDWLAIRFVEGKWSLKSLHRLIMLSSTYQMSSTHDPHASEIDPDNRLLWRQSIRRLESEEIRDSLLAVSGLLDRTPGGSLLHVKNRAFLFDHTSIDKTRYDSLRRAVYLPVIRNHLYDVFQLFDSTDATVPSGNRATTTVAPQALFMMNSELVSKASESLASRLLSISGDDAARVQALYLRAYAREPDTAETVRALRLVAKVEAALADKEADAGKRRLKAWGLLAQVVLAANEFVYVR